MDSPHVLILFFVMFLLSACSTALRPFETERVEHGQPSMVEPSLRELPPPKEKIVAAVYRFSDQTGQYKPASQVASWSTAVTQGSTSILIKAMTNSGWFIPIERENLSNLLNERKIINSTRMQNNDRNVLPPLLFAGIILEGGIIGYDTNIITGGAGVRYLGMGGSGEYRKDQVTIYLRAVSTQTGRILKTVHTTKSIISQKLDGGVFRFVDENRLLEAEAGFTFNEPPVMAVTEAIDEALRVLVIEGVDDKLWTPSDMDAFKSYMAAYKRQNQPVSIEKQDYFGLETDAKFRSGNLISVAGLYGNHIGNYSNTTYEPGVQVEIEQFMKNGLSVKLNVMRTAISVKKLYAEPLNGVDLFMNYYVTPKHRFSPYVGIGGGMVGFDKLPAFAENQFFPTASANGGLDYRISPKVGLRLGGGYRYLILDGLDGVKMGTIHDQQWNVSLGLTIKP
jgi:curli production assembly/transport component CsgG